MGCGLHAIWQMALMGQTALHEYQWEERKINLKSDSLRLDSFVSGSFLVCLDQIQIYFNVLHSICVQILFMKVILQWIRHESVFLELSAIFESKK